MKNYPTASANSVVSGAVDAIMSCCSYMDPQESAAWDALVDSGLENNTKIIYTHDHGVFVNMKQIKKD